MPTLQDRAGPAWVTRARAPAWDARCAPHRAGLRPGRSGQEAIAALVTARGPQAQDVLEAASAQGGDRLAHTALLPTVHPSPRRHRQRQPGRTAGVRAQGPVWPTATGTRPGGHRAPCRAGLACHGLEARLGQTWPRRGRRRGQTPTVVGEADGLVSLPEERTGGARGQAGVSAWLRERGCTLQPSPTRLPLPEQWRRGPRVSTFAAGRSDQSRWGKPRRATRAEDVGRAAQRASPRAPPRCDGRARPGARRSTARDTRRTRRGAQPASRRAWAGVRPRPASAAHAPSHGSTTRGRRGGGAGRSPVIPSKRPMGGRAHPGAWTRDQAGGATPRTGRGRRRATTTHRPSARCKGKAPAAPRTETGCPGADAADAIPRSHRAAPGSCSHHKGEVEPAVCPAWRVTPATSLTSGPSSTEGARRETIAHGDLAMVTRRKPPGRRVAQGRLTRATVVRSRMNGNGHGRLCRRVGMVTSRLRQRRDGSPQPGKDTQPGHVGPEQDEPTSLRARAHRVCPETDTACADARATEEPDAGTLHVRDCTGGAG
jgi:hypothetical protein